MRTFVHNAFQSNYLSACVELGGYSSNNVMAWLLPTAIARLTECVPAERPQLLELIAGEISGRA